MIVKLGGQGCVTQAQSLRCRPKRIRGSFRATPAYRRVRARGMVTDHAADFSNFKA